LTLFTAGIHFIFKRLGFCILLLPNIVSIKKGNDNVPIEDNCLEEELATTPKLSEIGTLSLTFVMLMRFFAPLNIYYKTFTSKRYSKIKKPLWCKLLFYHCDK
jgi:hypothetical protein